MAIQWSVSSEEPRVRTVLVVVSESGVSTSEISTLRSGGDRGEVGEGGQDCQIHGGTLGVRQWGVSTGITCQTVGLYSADCQTVGLYSIDCQTVGLFSADCHTVGLYSVDCQTSVPP